MLYTTGWIDWNQLDAETNTDLIAIRADIEDAIAVALGSDDAETINFHVQLDMSGERPPRVEFVSERDDVLLALMITIEVVYFRNKPDQELTNVWVSKIKEWHLA